jgi:hypothetical protein
VRELPTIRSIINQNDNKFVGLNKAHGRVTVEPAWQLNITGQSYGQLENGPYRYWAFNDNSQVELEVPNIDSISINRSLDQEAATCTIIMSNQVMDDNDESPSNLEFGNPGYYGFGYGDAPDSLHLWLQQENVWNNVLVPNALLRTYQGYGGYSVINGQLVPDPVVTAVSNGNLVLTGVWLIDTVSMGTNGKIQFQCRDMAKLLIEQSIYPPLCPERFYPPEYYRYDYINVPSTPGSEGVPEGEGEVLGPSDLAYENSSPEIWFGSLVDQPPRSLNPRGAFSFNETDIAYGKGWSEINNTYAYDWWQASCNTELNEIYVNCKGEPAGGSYTVWVSIMEDGVWQGSQVIPYEGDDPGSNVQLYHPDKPSLNTGIAYVKKQGVQVKSGVNENLADGTWIALDRTYRAQKVRVTIKSTWYWEALTNFGAKPYRSAVGAIRARLSGLRPAESERIQVDGNIRDWLDVVKELLLWSGFLLYDGEDPTSNVGVFGVLETSGTYPVEALGQELFDKKAVIDALISIKEVLGYVFFIDEEGSVHFHSPNWWSEGNTNELGQRLNYIHEISDENVMTDYTSNFTDINSRSEIVIGSSLVDENASETQFVSFDPRAVEAPDSPDILRGMVKPAIWQNEVWTNETEQKLMAALIALHSMFNSRQGSVTIVANPEIQINDQVRILERVTSEAWIHYVRSITSDMNLETGEWTMTLGTNWLGELDVWAFDRNLLLSLYDRQSRPRDTGYDNGYEAWEAFQDSRDQDLRIPTVSVAPDFTNGVGGNYVVAVVVGRDPGDGRTPVEIADTDIVGFMQQAGIYAGVWIDYVFSSTTHPSFPYDVILITEDAVEEDINAWGSLALVDKPTIHAKPACWDNNEITGVAATSANSSTIGVQTNSAFEIGDGFPATVTFGDGGVVTTFAVDAVDLPTGTVSVGESSLGDIVIGAIPSGQTYDDSNVSTVKHVIWGSNIGDPDLYASIAWETMGDAILWLRSI